MSDNAAGFTGSIPEEYDHGLGPVIFADRPAFPSRCFLISLFTQAQAAIFNLKLAVPRPDLPRAFCFAFIARLSNSCPRRVILAMGGQVLTRIDRLAGCGDGSFVQLLHLVAYVAQLDRQVFAHPQQPAIDAMLLV
jgi:hypothetical protein